ncbi:MAG: hypothetical protein AAF449_01685 [Myxococcota bacterium]
MDEATLLFIAIATCISAALGNLSILFWYEKKKYKKKNIAINNGFSFSKRAFYRTRRRILRRKKFSLPNGEQVILGPASADKLDEISIAIKKDIALIFDTPPHSATPVMKSDS